MDNSVEFEFLGSKYKAYWCLSEDTTRQFPRVKALSSTSRSNFRQAYFEGVRLLKSTNLNVFSENNSLTLDCDYPKSGFLSQSVNRRSTMSDVGVVTDEQNLYQLVAELSGIAFDSEKF